MNLHEGLQTLESGVFGSLRFGNCLEGCRSLKNLRFRVRADSNICPTTLEQAPCFMFYVVSGFQMLKDLPFAGVPNSVWIAPDIWHVCRSLVSNRVFCFQRVFRETLVSVEPVVATRIPKAFDKV